MSSNAAYPPGRRKPWSTPWTGSRTILPAGQIVANLSLQDGLPDSTLGGDLENAIADGITIVACAGNHGEDIGSHAIADLSDAIVVAATGGDDAKPSWSDYGSTVAVFAPGEDIVTDDAGSDSGTLGPVDGTSYSSPIVAGIVARYLQANSIASPSDVRAAIVDNATSDVVSNPGSGSPNKLAYSGFFGPGLSGSFVMNGDSYLYNGDYILSSNGGYKLHFDLDRSYNGQLYLYDVEGGVDIWDSEISGGSEVYRPSGPGACDCSASGSAMTSRRSRRGALPLWRITLMSALAAAWVGASCRATPTSPDTPQSVQLTQVLSFPALLGNDILDADLPVILRDQDSYDRLWSQIAKDRPDLSAPAVDFGRDFLLVARHVGDTAAGMTVDSASEQRDVIEVHLTYSDLCPGYGTTGTGPVIHLVLVPFQSGRESFVYDIRHTLYPSPCTG